MFGLVDVAAPFWPQLGPASQQSLRLAYGVLLLATLVRALPDARRYFLSERWGGYGTRGWAVDTIQNPIVLPFLYLLWLVAANAIVFGVWPVVAAGVNVVICHYFFVQMRWQGVLRGMGAPGFITYWLGAALFLVSFTAQYAPEASALALLVLQVDFAAIMLSAGLYKLSAGYRRGDGMELGMVNPEWGHWSGFWAAVSPRNRVFQFFNEMAWGTEVVAAVLMLLPPTRFAGGFMMLASFVLIASQIRLGFLSAMVMACCLVFFSPGSLGERALASVISAPPEIVATPAPALVVTVLVAGLWLYLALLPLARAGLSYNFHAKRPLPGAWQAILEHYTNLFGMVLWRVFSADITNFFVRIYEQPRAGGDRRLLSSWGRARRYRQVAEAIAVTTLFTTRKYYPSNRALFVERLLRYARTVPHRGGQVLVFEYVTIVKRPTAFAYVPAAEFAVDVAAGTVQETTLVPGFDVQAPSAFSPIHEGARPGSYVPLSH